MYTQNNTYSSFGTSRSLRSWGLFVLLVLGFSQAYAQLTLNFGDSADFVLLTSNGSAGAVTWSADSGVGGVSGHVAVSLTVNQANTMYYSNAIDPETYALTASYYFLADAFTANSNVSRIALGISTGTTDNLSGATAPIMARLIKNANATSATFEIRSAAAGFNNTTGVTLTDGNWYKLTAAFTPNATSDNYSVSATLEDYGSDGLTFQSLVASASGTRNSATTFFSSGEALPVYFGFMAQDNGGGAIAIDNLTVPGTAAIPEPSAAAWLTGGAVLALGIMHRLRRGSKGEGA